MKLFNAVCILAFAIRSALAVTNPQPDQLVSKNGKLDVTLNISYELSLDGKRLAPNYNGKPIGPTIRVKPGDKLTVTLNNLLPPGTDLDRELYTYIHNPQNEIDEFMNMTIIYNRLSEIGSLEPPLYGFWGTHYMNIHFHGADFPPSIEDIRNAIDGGESKTYTFKIPDDQEPGLMWYHNHFHGIAAYTYLAGLYGFFVIEGTEETITAGIKEDYTETFLMLSEFYPEKEESLTPARFIPVAFAFDWTSITNGFDGADTIFEYKENELVLFRTASATTEPNINLSIQYQEDGGGETPVKLVPIAYDNFAVPSLGETESIQIGGGQRVEFLARFEKPGTYIIRRAPWTILGITGTENCLQFFGAEVPACFSYDVEKIIATVNVSPVAGDGLALTPAIDTVDLPVSNSNLQKLAAMEPVDTKTFLFELDQQVPLFQVSYIEGQLVPPGAVAFGINGAMSTPFRDFGTVQAGTCETWTINQFPPGVEHPFHVHTADFLVTHYDNVAVEEPLWRDTVIIPMFNVTVKVCFDRNIPGDQVLFHCHMAVHQDVGMAGFVKVVEGPVSPTPSPTVKPKKRGRKGRKYMTMMGKSNGGKRKLEERTGTADKAGFFRGSVV